MLIKNSKLMCFCFYLKLSYSTGFTSIIYSKMLWRYYTGERFRLEVLLKE